jgi:arylsulfatase A-like enzyme
VSLAEPSKGRGVSFRGGGYRTPNIDRIGREGAVFTDWYGQQSCTAGRAAFITGQTPIRTGLTKVGLPGAELGLGPLDPSVADVLKTYGYTTGQFGKNHLGDRDEHLSTAHGFDEFFGNLYHLNAEEEPENSDYPKDPEFRKRFGPRGVIKSSADGKIENTGPLNTKRMETIDEEFLGAAKDFINRQHRANKPWFCYLAEMARVALDVRFRTYMGLWASHCKRQLRPFKSCSRQAIEELDLADL